MLKGLGTQRPEEQEDAPARESRPEGQSLHCDRDVRLYDELYVPSGHGDGASAALWQ